MKKGQLFVVSGPSGAGKGSICQRLVKELDVELSVSMTTRSPRPGEIEGVNYYFVTRDEFKESMTKGDLLECAEVYGNFYGTPKQKVLDKLAAGKDVVLEIDIQGALKVRNAYPQGIYIFILPPSMTELRKRITRRGSDSPDSIELRLGETLTEISYIDKYNYCVVNEDLEEAVKRVEAIILAEHSRVSEQIYELIKNYKEEV